LKNGQRTFEKDKRLFAECITKYDGGKIILFFNKDVEKSFVGKLIARETRGTREKSKEKNKFCLVLILASFECFAGNKNLKISLTGNLG